MIEGLDGGDAGTELRVRARDMCCQLLLSARRSRDQNRAGAAQRLRHLLQKGRLQADVAAAARIGLVMQVLMGMAAADRAAVHRLSVEVKDLRLLMVDPYDGMIMIAHDTNLALASHCPRSCAAAPAAPPHSPACS